MKLAKRRATPDMREIARAIVQQRPRDGVDDGRRPGASSTADSPHPISTMACGKQVAEVLAPRPPRSCGAGRRHAFVVAMREPALGAPHTASANMSWRDRRQSSTMRRGETGHEMLAQIHAAAAKRWPARHNERRRPGRGQRLRAEKHILMILSAPARRMTSVMPTSACCLAPCRASLKFEIDTMAESRPGAIDFDFADLSSMMAPLLRRISAFHLPSPHLYRSLGITMALVAMLPISARN